MANPSRAYIAVWGAYKGDGPDYGYELPPDYVYETSDPQILSLIHDIFREDHFSQLQQPLVTRMDPIT